MSEIVRFPSLGTLRSAHTDLLKRRREEQGALVLDDVAQFIADGRAAGAVLDNDVERETAQSLLDYWATVLLQADRWDIDATLDEFDPELAPELPDEPCPYVGLNTFHAPRFFFGRERLINQMLERLRLVRLLAVVGPSGSGKSSAVLAGLLPALRRGAIPNSEEWHILPRMVPGSHPLTNLARLLSQQSEVPGDTGGELASLVAQMQVDSGTLVRLVTTFSPRPVVLVIDQFEESFTLCGSETERVAFVQNLLALTSMPSAEHRVILTMRSDFESWISRIPALQNVFDQGRIQATPLNADEIRRAIVEPAELVGLRFQAGIVDALIAEILGEPAALPLLQFTLRALWDERRRNRITWDVYNQIGGGRTALARAADRLFHDLIPEEQVTARRILLRMVRPGSGLEVTSNRVAIDELLAIGEDPGRVERVMERLLAAHLLKQSDGDVAADRQVEVAHEALIRNWPTLVEWLDQEREVLRHRRRLTDAVERWLALNRDESLLWRGAQLNEATAYPDLSAAEQAFVSASQVAEDQIIERARRNRQLQMLGVVLIFLAIMTALGVYAWGQRQLVADQVSANATIAVEKSIAEQAVIEAQWQSELREVALAQAETAARTAKAGELASYALVELDVGSDPTGSLGLLLAREAVLTTWRTQEPIVDSAAKVLSQAVKDAPRWYLTLPGTDPKGNRVNAVAWSPDGGRIVTGVSDSTARIWDVATGAEIHILRAHTDQVRSVAWSPNGSRILTGGHDGMAVIWDAESGELLLELSGHNGLVTSVAWSPDGLQIATGSSDGVIRIWRAAEGVQRMQLSGHSDWVRSLAWSPDSQQILSGGGDNDSTARIWDANTGSEVLRLEGHLGSLMGVAWSPDGARVVTASSGNTARIWDATTGDTLSVLTGHGGGLSSVAWSPDGAYILTGGSDSTARVWDAATGRELRVLRGHRNWVRSVNWSPDSQAMVTGSDDGLTRLWRINEPIDLLELSVDPDGDVLTVDWSPNGGYIATGSSDGLVRIWNADTGRLQRTLEGHIDWVRVVSWSPDGDLLLSAGNDDTARLWDTTTGELLHVLIGHTNNVYAAAWSPDGRRIVTGGLDQTARVWDVASGTELVLFTEHKDIIFSIAWSPDGRQIASAAGDRDAIRVWRPDDGTQLVSLGGGSPMIAWSPDSQRLLAGRWRNAEADIWLIERVSQELSFDGHTNRVQAGAWSPSSARVVTGSADGTARIWDAETGMLIFSLIGHTGEISSVDWSPDGSKIVTGSADGTVRVWLDLESLLDAALDRIQRNPPELSPQERLRYGILSS